MTFRGASRGSLGAARERLEALVSAAGTDVIALGEELFSVVYLLDREISLRRVLTDPSRSAEQKASLVESLFGSRLGPAANEVVTVAVRGRWSAPRDLADALETLAVHSEVAAADRAGQLDDLEDELFRFGRIVAGQPGLRAALADPALPVARKTDLVAALLDGKVTEAAARLVGHLIAHPRGRTVEHGLEEYAKFAAARRERLIALVRVAVPLAADQKERLERVLRRLYSREIHLNIEIDPTVLGGISVQLGDEVIDGTIASRLDGAHRRLAG